MVRHIFHGILGPVLAISTLLSATGPTALAQTAPRPSIVRKLQSTSERMEMTVNTSRILSLDQKIPQAQVNNPEILHLTPLSPNQIQVSAKKPGVTQVNLWTEGKQIYTVDVIVRGDARELGETLKSQFPSASLQVVPVANSVMISGYVDQPEHVNHIIRIAEEYYPKVINNITVSGVQQVLLHVRVMEVSRTKLRSLGFDFAKLTGRNLVASSVSGLISGAVAGTAGSVNPNGTFTFQVIEPGGSFFGVLDALREDKLLKILAEPTLTAISGRPAYFQVGGSVPTLVPQSLGTVTVEYKKYGTQVDFVPIVLGDGKIRLEVRPRVSDIDNARSVQYQGYTIYAFNEREVETGVEMMAGQTLAIAGLVQNRMESQRRGLPWVSEVPYLGALFRRVEEYNNEIELLIMVTPELVDPLDPHEVPPCGPGTRTVAPNDWELYMKGHIEVPKCCPSCDGDGCAQCGSRAAGETTLVDPSGPAMPGMILQPEPATPEAAPSTAPRVEPPKPVPETASHPALPNPHNQTSPQVPDSSNQLDAKKPLPGFKGQVGYEMVR